MDREIIDLPCSLFGPITRDWHIDPRGQSAGDGVDGNGQVVYSAQPRWVATLDYNLIRRDRIMVWRALMAKMRGRVNIIRICLCDPFRPNYSSLGIPNANDDDRGVPHSDDAYFSDDTGYDHEITYTLSFASAAGVDTITIAPTAEAAVIEAGHYISIDSWLYMVTSVLPQPGGSRRIGIEPNLRRAITTATTIKAEAEVLMVFETDESGRATLSGGLGSSSLQLVEWINRP